MWMCKHSTKWSWKKNFPPYIHTHTHFHSNFTEIYYSNYSKSWNNSLWLGVRWIFYLVKAYNLTLSTRTHTKNERLWKMCNVIRKHINRIKIGPKNSTKYTNDTFFIKISKRSSSYYAISFKPVENLIGCGCVYVCFLVPILFVEIMLFHPHLPSIYLWSSLVLCAIGFVFLLFHTFCHEKRDICLEWKYNLILIISLLRDNPNHLIYPQLG